MSDRLLKNQPILRRPDLEALMPAQLRAAGVQVFTFGDCHVLATHEPWNLGWHLSISCHDRDPTWDEIVTARYGIAGDIPNMAMFLPKLEDYVNIHAHTFHLYESKVDASKL